MVYFLAWVIFTIVLLGFTLARPHPYRFPRFLAFESILSLIFLNAEVWFQDRFISPPDSVLDLPGWFHNPGESWFLFDKNQGVSRRGF